MSFINSSYLFGLLGFIIPLIIHLWNKKEVKLIKVGSIQFISSQESKKSKSIKINEIFLLFLRCWLIGLFSMLMAGMLSDRMESNTRIALIDPELLNDIRIKRAIDTLNNDYEIRLLFAGLPVLKDDNLPSGSPQNFWELVNDINGLEGDSILVLSGQRINKTEGKVPEINKVLKWISIDPIEGSSYLACVYLISDQYHLFYGYSDGVSTTYKKEKVEILPSELLHKGNLIKHRDQKDWIEIQTMDTLEITICYDKDFEKDKTIIEAIFKGIKDFTGFPITINVQNTPLNNEIDSNWMVWLSNDEPPSFNSNSIIYQPNNFKKLLYQSTPEKIYFLNDRLNYTNVLADNLANSLLNALYQFKIDENDQRIVGANQVNPVYNSYAKMNKSTKEGSSYIWWLVLMVLLIVERFISMKKAL